jgi:hypothetical protein
MVYFNKIYKMLIFLEINKISLILCYFFIKISIKTHRGKQFPITFVKFILKLNPM